MPDSYKLSIASPKGFCLGLLDKEFCIYVYNYILFSPGLKDYNFPKFEHCSIY